MRTASISGIAAWFRDRFAGQSSLFGNASATAFGTLVNAGLGFVYWWLAARAFPAEAVGIGAAVISIMGLCALMGEFGLGTLLLGELPKRKERVAGLVLAALSATFVLALICGFAVAGLARWVAPDSPISDSSLLVVGMFVLGTAVNGVMLTLDQAFVGMLRGQLQMYRNVAFAVFKLLFLGVAAWWVASSSGAAGLLASWVLGMIVSIVVVAIVGGERRWRPFAEWADWRGLRGLVRNSLDHHVLNLATQAPGLLMPFLVAVLVSPEANAAFFAAWMLVGVALLMPAALTTVLFSVGRSDPARLPERLRLSLAVSLLVGLCAGGGFLLLSDWMLWLFNPRYPELAGNSLQLLGFAVPAIAVKYHYSALKRLEDAMLRASVVFGIGGLAEVLLASFGAYVGGLQGMTIGLVTAVWLQAAYMIWPVSKVARGGGHGVAGVGRVSAGLGVEEISRTSAAG